MINIVHGDGAKVADACLRHRELAGIHFTGSTKVFQSLWRGVGENIAFGYPSAESVHLGWYNSSGHHRNMVLGSYYQIGVGRSGTYWTQNFGMGRPDL